MPILYLTPAALGYLTQFILTAAITLYLVHLVRRTPRAARSADMVLMTGFFVAATLLIALFALDASLTPTVRLYVLFWENIAAGLGLIFLLQFAYHFPRLDPHKKWEARAVLTLSILYTLWETQFAIYRFGQLSAGLLDYRPAQADYVLVAGFLWALVVLIRQAIYTATPSHAQSWLRKLWQPQGREAQAARALALVYIFPVCLNLATILKSSYWISATLYQLILTAGIQLALFVLAAVYLNALPERTSFMVKLAGVMLLILLSVLGAVGWVSAPAYAAGYRPALADHQTLRFVPNPAGGYDVVPVPFRFDEDWGRDLGIVSGGQMLVEPLDFTFPFYGQTRQTIYLTDNGMVGVGRAFRHSDLEYRYGPAPAIFPLGMDLSLGPGHGLFAKNEGERLTLTWSSAQGSYRKENEFTFQLVLYRSGVFEITYNGLPGNLAFDVNDAPYANVWMVGAVPGYPVSSPQEVNLSNLPVHGGPQGIVQDYYLDFRRYMNDLMSPLAGLIVFGSLLVVAGIPLLLSRSLIAPLNRLLAGMQQVNLGNRDLQLPIQYPDEIGFLTESFNAMVVRLRALVSDLAAREQKYRTLFEDAPVCILEVDLTSVPPAILRINGEVKKMYGWPPGEMVGATLDRLAPSSVVSRLERLLLLRGAGELVALETFSTRSSGEVFPTRLSASARTGVGLGDVVVIIQDTTLERERRSREEAVNDERRRIAQEIHDGLIQNLAGLRVQVGHWHRLVEHRPEQMHAELDQLQEVLGSSIADMRRLILALRPVALERGGFFPALEQMVANFSAQHDLPVKLEIEGSRQLPVRLELPLFRIVQEALSNVGRHAHAQEAWVTLDLRPAAQIVVTIQDDGRGFDPTGLDEALRQGHLGLRQMRERVQELQGTLEIHSQPGQGTALRVTLPR